MITDEKINEAVNRIKKNVDPDKIILFGSYAKGDPTEDSDLDLLIIKEMDLPRHKRVKEVKKHLRGIKIPIDLLVYTSKEINVWEGTEASFVNQVMKHGIVLYEKE